MFFLDFLTMMELSNNPLSILWWEFGFISIAFISFIYCNEITEQYVMNNCVVSPLDKSVYQGSYNISPNSKNCVVLDFAETPFGSDESGEFIVDKKIFVTLFNTSVSPLFCGTDYNVYPDEEQPKMQFLLDPQRLCSCDICAVPLARNGTLSVSGQISKGAVCLSTLPAQLQRFKIHVGGRLLILAKTQQSSCTYRLAYKYIYETMCPTLDELNFFAIHKAKWCPNSQEHPDDRLCISSRWECDGLADCADASDESCCPPRFTRCAPWQELAGKCVPRCDGVWECQEAVADFNCCPEPNLRCRVPVSEGYIDDQGEYQSAYQCLAASRRCNGLADCADALDELGCDASTCRPENDTYLCGHDVSGRCIKQKFVCDGRPNCPNGDDEAFCPISRRLNVILCMSGLFSSASVLFVIAYFHRRYCMTYRRNRGRHRRRRFDLMSPVEQAARYFMQMCGAPPSYSQIIQLGGSSNDTEPLTPADELASAHAAAVGVGSSGSMPVGHEREMSSSDDSSEVEYLSALTFPGSSSHRSSGAHRVDLSVQVHALASIPAVSPRAEELAEYAECADDPSAEPGIIYSPPFAVTVSEIATPSDLSNNIEMLATSTVITEADQEVASTDSSLPKSQQQPDHHNQTNDNDDDK